MKVALGTLLSRNDAGLEVGEVWLDRGALHPTQVKTMLGVGQSTPLQTTLQD